MAVANDIADAGSLARALPRVIETDAENDRMIAELGRLDSLSDRTPVQESLPNCLPS